MKRCYNMGSPSSIIARIDKVTTDVIETSIEISLEHLDCLKTSPKGQLEDPFQDPTTSTTSSCLTIPEAEGIKIEVRGFARFAKVALPG